MTQPQIAPYGSWKSPITAAEVFAKSIGIRELQLDGETLYWSERRPEGRTVIVRRSPDGEIVDVTPPGFNVRTRVHEYGGGSYIVVDGVLYFSNFSDQRLYRQRGDAAPEALSTLEGMRYADASKDFSRRRLILIREDHTTAGEGGQPTNSICAIDLEDGREELLVSGNDFYSTPRLNGDGTRLAWLTWNHPNMPWDMVELWVGEVLADGSIGRRTLVAGEKPESIFQPEWSPDGSLYFVADRSNWWNLYRWREGPREGQGGEGQGGEDQGVVESLAPMAAEFAIPQWVFGLSTYALVTADRLFCTYLQDGVAHLASVDTRSLKLTPIGLPYTVVRDPRVTSAAIYFVGGSPTKATELVQMELATGKIEVLRRSHEIAIDPAYISSAVPVEFPTTGGVTAHGFYYPPKNRDFAGPADARPPLLVQSHGGPTAAAESVLAFDIQFWTSRGFALLDVNYGGSTGYGRDYRERLKGQWGIVDVDDCINGAKYLVAQDLVDPNQLAIDGGSAGGFTTLAALTFHDTFKAGASYFGVSDLEALARDTHKFESRYLDGLVAPYPQERQVYLDRSPIHHTHLLECPIILLQGLDDPIVPPNQAEMMFEAVRARELPVAYVAFPGEQHGFRKAENNRRALEAELYFYSKVFNFDLADEIEPVDIENL